jgi:hypothetical protein
MSILYMCHTYLGSDSCVFFAFKAASLPREAGVVCHGVLVC